MASSIRSRRRRDTATCRRRRSRNSCRFSRTSPSSRTAPRPSAQIPGYTVAGKTGTAQVPDSNGLGYVPGDWNATFVGFVPAQAPQLSGIVVLNHPDTIYGGLVSAPVFAQVMGYALAHFDIAPPSSAAGNDAGHGSGDNLGCPMTEAPARSPASVTLDRLLPAISTVAVLGDPSRVVVDDIVFDHRKVRPGALFCCLPGEHRDGHDFAPEAHRAGAVAFVCEHSLRDVGGAVQLVVTPGTARIAMAGVACAFFGDPARAMRTVGVTGTNGKTTTTYLLRSIFEHHGWQGAVLGTLDGARTTPESPELQRTLRAQLADGVAACALEVSSHALVQHRVDGIVFDAALFTNLTQDHLDYHENMEAYFEAKAELFTPEHAAAAVVNADDPYGARLLERQRCIPMVGYSLGDVRDLEVGLSARAASDSTVARSVSGSVASSMSATRLARRPPLARSTSPPTRSSPAWRALRRSRGASRRSADLAA